MLLILGGIKCIILQSTSGNSLYASREYRIEIEEQGVLFITHFRRKKNLNLWIFQKIRPNFNKIIKYNLNRFNDK